MWCILIIVLVVWVMVTAFGTDDMLFLRPRWAHQPANSQQDAAPSGGCLGQASGAEYSTRWRQDRLLSADRVWMAALVFRIPFKNNCIDGVI
jgi:hypothetical protein